MIHWLPETARTIAFVLACAIVALGYRPLRFFGLAVGVAILSDLVRVYCLPLFRSAPPRAISAIDLLFFLAGLTCATACVAATFAHESTPFRANRWALSLFVLFAFFELPYPAAPWTHDRGLALSLSSLMIALLYPQIIAFARWYCLRRSLRTEHVAGLALIFAHLGMVLGPYNPIWPDPFAGHRLFAEVLFTAAFCAAIWGEVKWLLERFR